LNSILAKGPSAGQYQANPTRYWHEPEAPRNTTEPVVQPAHHTRTPSPDTEATRTALIVFACVQAEDAHAHRADVARHAELTFTATGTGTILGSGLRRSGVRSAPPGGLLKGA
jgi:hypothetical protein